MPCVKPRPRAWTRSPRLRCCYPIWTLTHAERWGQHGICNSARLGVCCRHRSGRLETALNPTPPWTREATTRRDGTAPGIPTTATVDLHPCGRRPVRRSRPRTSFAELATRPDGSHWLNGRDRKRSWVASGPPRACDCAKGHATLLCYFNYDEWHPEYSLLCPPCWRSQRNWHMIEAVEAVWDGRHWCHPDASSRLVRPAARGPDHAASGAARGSADRRQRTAGLPRTPALSVRESARLKLPSPPHRFQLGD